MRDYKYGDFYFDSQHDKQMKIDVVGTGIVIDNSMIEMEAFELDEALCSESELKFGRCETNCVKFTARNLTCSINGKTINVTETIDGNTDEPFPYGKYKVQSDVPTSDRTKREITAYDAMYDIINADMKSWYAGLSFPMKLKQFRDSFFAYFGITQKETTLVNDGMTVNKTLTATQTDSESTITEESSISGKTVIEAICEINGVFGNINHDGEFEYVELEPIIKPLYPSNDLYPREDLFPRDPNTISMTGHYITFDYEDFQSKAITQLEIRPSDDSAGVIVGTSGNNYVISGNFLVSDKTGAELEAIAENTLSVIKKAAYIPIKSSEIVGNPCIELGDPIRFNTTREIVESYVLQRTLTGIQSKRDSITASGTETHSQNPNGIKGQFESVTRRTNKLERTADHTLSELADLDASTTSRFEQTADAITAEATRAQGAEGNLSSQISIVAGEVSSKVSSGDVVSEINQSAEQITLRGNRLVVESNNFQLDADGNVYIVQSLGFKDSSYGQNTDIIGLDGRGNPVLQHARIDLDSVSDLNGYNIATENYVDQTIPDFSGYINSVGSASWSEIDSNSWVVTSFSLSKSGSSIYVSGNHIKKNLSDQRLKEHLGKLDERYAEFYKMLNPIIFKFHDDIPTIKGKHFGLYANEVADALDKANIDRSGLRLVWQSDVDSEAHEDRYVNDKTWNLDYDELHALHIYMIQGQQKEIEQLKSDNFSLKGEVDILKQRLGKMEEMLNVINSKIN